jgi:hypothetical protein
MAESLKKLANRMHVMASQNHTPTDLPEEDAKALLQLQLQASAPIRPPWYRGDAGGGRRGRGGKRGSPLPSKYLP